ncbi:DUF4012 domain-containing protein [Microbacterium sp. USHLN272]|uniref:DUF4012 domain-containing protein n=1 Tax=Microbacterium sp. USHLN272 TaxID=3081287 RepID=UPI003015E21F
MTSETSSARRRHRAGRISAWVLGGLLVISVAGAAWIGIRGYAAYQHLDSARSAAERAPEVLKNPAAAPALVEQISSDTSAAHALTDDVVWKLGEMLPWVGPQLEAVSTVSAALDDIASNSLDPLVSVATTFSIDSIRPQDGVIDTAPFVAIAPAAASSAESLGAAVAKTRDIDTELLIAPLRDAVDEVSGLVAQTYFAVDALHRACELMPAMLGSDGPRDYLLVFQNNAEWRSLGGIVGAALQLHTEGGHISLVAQGSSSDFPRYDEAVVTLSADEQQLFGTQPARFIQNVTQIPDFSRGAPIAREMWLRETGVDVDGVIALDPVALSYLLKATGPVTLPTGDVLSGDNAVDLLLNEVYHRYADPRAQDAFFASAAGAVFSTLTSGAGSPSDLLTAMARSGSENRLLIWNREESEQKILDGTTLQGAIPETDATTTSFGVYANDSTASKMDYFQTLATSTSWCGPDLAQLDVTIRNNAPADAGGLPAYITGGGGQGVSPGEIKTAIYVYLPQGSTPVSIAAGGDVETPGFGGGIDRGRDVVVWTVQLAPGQSATLAAQVSTPTTPHIVTRTTPTIDEEVTSDVAPECGIPK